MPQKRLLFLCYSHADMEWMNRIREAFAKHAQGTELDAILWCDQDIAPGDLWQKKINDALKQSRAALLVVTQNFHKSSYIGDKELPELLEAQRKGRLLLTWIHAERVNYRHLYYTETQAVIDPEPALSELEKQDQDRKIDKIADKLIRLLRGQSCDSVAPDSEKPKRKGRIACGMIALILLLLSALSIAGTQPRPDRSDLLRLLHKKVWLGYEPADFDPQSSTNIDDKKIRNELRIIRQLGFTGIVTYNSRDGSARIPALARQEHLAVIMGVWNPLDPREIRNAYEQRMVVDAYCVGHNGLDSMYNEADLERSIRWLRRMTCKPVTTTQLSRRYSSTSKRLNRMGDFLFPDIHHNLTVYDVDADLKDTISIVTKMAILARRYDRPLMLKMVIFPTRQAANAPDDLRRQTKYLAGLLEAIRDPQRDDFREPAYALHGAFDAPWKQGGNFRSWDPYTGLFDRSGTPRPAAKEWIRLNQ